MKLLNRYCKFGYPTSYTMVNWCAQSGLVFILITKLLSVDMPQVMLQEPSCLVLYLVSYLLPYLVPVCIVPFIVL